MTVDRKCLINWVGGKRLLRKTIAPLIPKDIKSYIEPFGGGGWVLFYKDRWADLEIYNDLDGRLVNLFRIVKYHPNKGYEMIEVERQNGINNREGTNRANKVYKELLIANYPIKEDLCK